MAGLIGVASRTAVVVPVLVVLGVATGCAGDGPPASGPPAAVATPAAPGPAEPTPVPAEPTPVPAGPTPAPAGPPSEYQVRLTRLDQELAGAFDRMRGSREPESLSRTTFEAAAVTAAAGERMRADPGDASVTKANAALAAALSQLAKELAFLGQQVHEQAVCTGPTAVEVAATAPSMPALRAVAAGLALPGEDGRTYRWGDSLPPMPPASGPPPLVNGAVLVDRRGPARGAGVLEARNEGAEEAVVVLARDGVAVLSVAVAPGRTAAVDGVPDGEYQLAYTSGRDWDARSGGFGRDCLFRRFTRPTPFLTRTTGADVDYTVQTVVVRPGASDTATADIPASALPG